MSSTKYPVPYASLTRGRRSVYDELMLSLHDAAKLDDAFQKNSPHEKIDFPAGSCWLTFTDMVLHATLVRATLEASIAHSEITDDGVVVPDELYANAGKFLAAQQRTAMVQHIQDIAGDFLARKTVKADDREFTANGDVEDYDNIRQFAVAYLRKIRRQKGYSFINIAGLAGERPDAYYIAGSCANAAMIMFSRSLGGDSIRHGVRVLPVDVCHSHWHCTLEAPLQAIRGVAQPQPDRKSVV